MSKKKEDSKRPETTILQELQETIIEMSKQLIIINNRIVQQSAKYNYLKQTLISQNFCAETLPRPNMTKRKPWTQTIGLPKVFGGTLDQYYEATGEIIPPVLESCIKYINTFGMKSQGIFRIGGAHVRPNNCLFSRCIFTKTLQADITKFEEEFEKGCDPFSVMDNANHCHAVAGVLKSYFRRLDEALFSETYFDQLMNITSERRCHISRILSVDVYDCRISWTDSKR